MELIGMGLFWAVLLAGSVAIGYVGMFRPRNPQLLRSQGVRKKKLLTYKLFPLHTGKWFLGWWLDNGSRVPEYHSKIFPTLQEAEIKRNQLLSKYRVTK